MFPGREVADGNSFAEVMTLLDWLCDSRADRFLSGNWVNLVTQNHAFHQNLRAGEDADATAFSQNPEKFAAACKALGGKPCAGGDMGIQWSFWMGFAFGCCCGTVTRNFLHSCGFCGTKTPPATSATKPLGMPWDFFCADCANKCKTDERGCSSVIFAEDAVCILSQTASGFARCRA